MRCLLRWTVLAVTVGILVPLVGAADTPAPARVTWTGAVAGRLDKLEKESLTLQVNVPELERINNTNKNRKSNNRGKGKANNNNQPRYRLEVEQKELNYSVAENLVVRRLQPGSGFDEKGNIKTYSAQELKEKKGPGNLPGYTAERDELRTGQVIEAFLGPGKNGKPQVVMVMIVSEAQTPAKGAKKK